MKILWIGPWRCEALCAQVRGSMARALHDEGHEVGSVVIGEEGSWKTGGYDWIEYLPVPTSLLGKIINQVRLVFPLLRFRGDVVVLGEKAAHLAAFVWLARKLGKRSRKIIIDVRTLPIPSSGLYSRVKARHFWFRLHVGFPFADGWMAITDNLRQAVERRVNTRSLPYTIWESAVDRSFLETDHVKPSEKILSCGHKWNILYLGSLSRGRRLDLVVRAMNQMHDESRDIGLHIVGSGDHRPELNKLVRELELRDCVHLWGPVPYNDVPSVIKACHVGILPLPDHEAWNTSSALKLYEYLACGIPILVSDIPAHRAAFDGQPFCFFMDIYSEEGFRAALDRIVSSTPERYDVLGHQARQYVRGNHTWDHRAHKISSFLEGLLHPSFDHK